MTTFLSVFPFEASSTSSCPRGGFRGNLPAPPTGRRHGGLGQGQTLRATTELRKAETQGLPPIIQVSLKGIILLLFCCSEVLRAAKPAERDYKLWLGGPAVVGVAKTHVVTGKGRWGEGDRV